MSQCFFIVESHQKATLAHWIAKAKTKEAARRAGTSRLNFAHFVRLFPAILWICDVEVGAWFAANQIRKTYLARVKGCFKKLLDPDSGRGSPEQCSKSQYRDSPIGLIGLLESQYIGLVYNPNVLGSTIPIYWVV